MKHFLKGLVDLGVGPDLPLEAAIPIRTANAVMAVLAIMSVMAALLGHFDAGSLPLAIGNLFFILFYAICLLLNGSGLHGAARLAVVTVLSLHFAFVNLAFGPYNGSEYYMLVGFSIPILIFARFEKLKIVAAYTIFIASFAATLAVSHRLGPVASVSESVLDRAYYFQFCFLTVVVLAAFAYYQNSLIDARLRLDAARQRAEAILLTLLPSWVADRLKAKETVAESHSEATVLFADLVGFSRLTIQLSPQHLVEVLNLLFSRFDAITTQFGVEKVRIIGDSYMVAGGIQPHRGGQAEAVAEVALEMLRVTGETAQETGIPLSLRVGIGTGPVVSGVLGTSKYTFDLWGDTVNLASSMESAGLPGRIQVTETTYWRLNRKFAFEKRGSISVKGHEQVETYFLLGHKQAEAVGR